MERVSQFSQEEKEEYMRLAIAEAKKAQEKGEVPIGAVVLHDKKIIGTGYNLRETIQKATAHAEMFALDKACEAIGSFRLEDCQLFVTLEPCPMCSGAMMLARVPEVYFGAFDPKGGTAGSLMNLLEEERFNHRAYVEGGILEKECGQLLKDFFFDLRQKKKAKKASILKENTLQ